jgi:hypothetical protein
MQPVETDHLFRVESLADLRRFDRALNRSQVFLLAKPLM